LRELLVVVVEPSSRIVAETLQREVDALQRMAHARDFSEKQRRLLSLVLLPHRVGLGLGIERAHDTLQLVALGLSPLATVVGKHLSKVVQLLADLLAFTLHRKQSLGKHMKTASFADSLLFDAVVVVA
jgi:hypothetical protein